MRLRHGGPTINNSPLNKLSRGTSDRSVHRDALLPLPGRSRLRLRRCRVRWSGRAPTLRCTYSWRKYLLSSTTD